MGNKKKQVKETDLGSFTRGKPNRRYKDRLFRMVFFEKKVLLELYNAVNGTNYEDEEELQVNTLEDVLYIGMKNDVSFLIGDTLNMYEHQCTYNPNMPLRGVFYFADLYQGYVEEHGENIYGTVPIRIPAPQYLVFYNGVKDQPDRTELYLSDSFIGQNKQATASLQCKVIMLNINLGHNKQLMEKCKKLMEYAQFVDMIRRYTDGKISFDETIDRAVTTCIREGILKDILQKNRAEVKNVLLTEFNERLFMEGFRREGRQEGIETATAKLNTLTQNLIKDNRLNDLEKSSRDPDLQKKLFEEYGI